MAEDERGASGPPSEASARSRAFTARRKAFDTAKAAADAAVATRHAAVAEQAHRQAGDQNPLVLLAGVAVLALLLAGFIFVFDRLRGDAWFSDCPAADGNCR